MKKLNLLFIAIIAITFNSCNEKYPELEDGMYAEIITTKGTAIAELYYKETPLTVANFVSLAEGTNTMVDDQYKGKKFYNGIIFHRIIKDFMIQTGDPLGTGTGDPGYKFPDEFSDSLNHKSKGILSMANSGPATNGSQFFITLKATPWLNGKHTVFGEVIKGLEVIDSIGAVKTKKPGDKPVDTVKMKEVNIIRKGSNAKSFDTKVAFEEKLKVLEKEKLEAEAIEKERQAKIALKFPAIAAGHAALRKKAVKLESGLEIHFIEKGNGAQPKPTDKVMINYAGHFADGKIFDTNKIDLAKEYGVFDERRAAHPKGYAPMEMKYSPDAQMIPGFKEGVQKMKVGDKAIIFIPPHLGYGDKARGPIPANSELIFEIDLVGIAEAPKEKK